MSLVYTRCLINDTINENGRIGQSHLQCEMHRDALVLASLRANLTRLKAIERLTEGERKRSIGKGIQKEIERKRAMRRDSR